MNDIPAIFGSMVFNDEVMRSRLPEDTYTALKRTMAQGARLELGLANVLAADAFEFDYELFFYYIVTGDEPLDEMFGRYKERCRERGIEKMIEAVNMAMGR